MSYHNVYTAQGIWKLFKDIPPRSRFVYMVSGITHTDEEWRDTSCGPDNFYAFYRYFLRSLFRDGLNQPEPHSPELERIIGKVPHIIGGIFNVHTLEQKYPDIQIEDKIFELVFAFFGDFHGRLDNRPTRDDNEINPGVLGYIFEKYINQKQMGA